MLEYRERVADAIKGSGLRYTIVRPNGFFNDMAEMFKMAESGTFWIIGDGKCSFNPIHGADLAAEIVSSISDETRWNSEFAVGGPESYTFREIGEIAFQELGRDPKLGYVPPWILTVASALVTPFNKNAGGILKAMSILGSRSDMVAPACGTHNLRDFYKRLAAEGGNGSGRS